MNILDPNMPIEKKIICMKIQLDMESLADSMVDGVLKAMEELAIEGASLTPEGAALNGYQLMMSLCAGAQKKLMHTIVRSLETKNRMFQKLSAKVSPEKLKELMMKLEQGDTTELDIIAEEIKKELDAEDNLTEAPVPPEPSGETPENTKESTPGVH